MVQQQLVAKFLKEVEKDVLGAYKHKVTVLLAVLPAPFVLSVLVFLLGGKSTAIVSTFSLGMVFVLVPYLLIGFMEFKEIKQAEDGFPGFLRDLAQSVAAGMTIPQAVTTAAQTKYGILSKYVQRLNAMLSWGIPFPQAWQKFTKLLEKSSLIKRINGVVLEAFYAGGEIGIVLSSLAADVNLLKRMEADKKSMAQEHIAVMYVVFFIFLGIVIGLHKILVPILYVQRIGVFGGLALRAAETISIDYFKNLFFIMTLVQAVSIGALAGQITEEKIIAGLKHIVFMIAAGTIAFFIFIFPAFLNMDVEVFPTNPALGQKITITGTVTFESQSASGAQLQIITPDKQVINTFTDGLGQFDTTVTAPLQPGVYPISITVTYSGQSVSVTKTVAVGLT